MSVVWACVSCLGLCELPLTHRLLFPVFVDQVIVPVGLCLHVAALACDVLLAIIVVCEL